MFLPGGIIWWICCVLFTTQLIVVLLYRLRIRNKQVLELGKTRPVSVIIPFHNEQDRIGSLIDAMNRQDSVPDAELIFVNDGSTDRTAEILQGRIKKPFHLLHLPEKRGKKAALDHGIRHAAHPFILTLDADVTPGDCYLNRIVRLPKADMTILPVNMRGDTLTGRLATIEFNWLQLLTFGSAQPVLCNGANLLFSKTAYLETYPNRSDHSIASGDDVFLLQAMLYAGKRIQRMPVDKLTVETIAPSSLAALLWQRKRWIGKFGRMKIHANLANGLFILVLQLAFFTALAGIIFSPWFMIPLLLKFLAEFMAGINRDHRYLPFLGLLAVHQFWYPFYLLMLLLPVSPDPKWTRQV